MGEAVTLPSEGWNQTVNRVLDWDGFPGQLTRRFSEVGAIGGLLVGFFLNDSVMKSHMSLTMLRQHYIIDSAVVSALGSQDNLMLKLVLFAQEIKKVWTLCNLSIAVDRLDDQQLKLIIEIPKNYDIDDAVDDLMNLIDLAADHGWIDGNFPAITPIFQG